jgi:predicted RNase H-like nuclease (RuvC/YqgF family)
MQQHDDITGRHLPQGRNRSKAVSRFRPFKVCIMSEPDLADILRFIRRMDEKVENLEGELRELKTHILRIENDVDKIQAHLNQHTNRLEERLGRIDRRLGIVETDV